MYAVPLHTFFYFTQLLTSLEILSEHDIEERF
jgi:hypothetical protein